MNKLSLVALAALACAFPARAAPDERTACLARPASGPEVSRCLAVADLNAQARAALARVPGLVKRMRDHADAVRAKGAAIDATLSQLRSDLAALQAASARVSNGGTCPRLTALMAGRQQLLSGDSVALATARDALAFDADEVTQAAGELRALWPRAQELLKGTKLRFAATKQQLEAAAAQLSSAAAAARGASSAASANQGRAAKAADQLVAAGQKVLKNAHC